MYSIAEGKQYLEKNWKKGAICPCCKQYVKLYKRQVGAQMVKWLVALYKLNRKNRDTYFHVSALLNNGKESLGVIGGDFAKMKYWGLIKEKPKDEGSDKRTSGYWKITGYGIQFIFKKYRIHKYALVFNQEFRGFEGEDVGVADCIKSKFSYDELMGDYVYTDIDFTKSEQIGINYDN